MKSQINYYEFNDDIKGTLKIKDLAIRSGKPEVHEKIIEVEPDMYQIRAIFKEEFKKSWFSNLFI